MSGSKTRAPSSRRRLRGFEFVAQVEPKTDPKGNPLPGSTINWKSIRPAGGADEAEAEIREAKANAEAENEEDFDDIPF
jgi:hypothetical protein